MILGVTFTVGEVLLVVAATAVAVNMLTPTGREATVDGLTDLWEAAVMLFAKKGKNRNNYNDQIGSGGNSTFGGSNNLHDDDEGRVTDKSGKTQQQQKAQWNEALRRLKAMGKDLNPMQKDILHRWITKQGITGADGIVDAASEVLPDLFNIAPVIPLDELLELKVPSRYNQSSSGYKRGDDFVELTSTLKVKKNPPNNIFSQ